MNPLPYPWYAAVASVRANFPIAIPIQFTSPHSSSGGITPKAKRQPCNPKHDWAPFKMLSFVKDWRWLLDNDSIRFFRTAIFPSSKSFATSSSLRRSIIALLWAVIWEMHSVRMRWEWIVGVIQSISSGYLLENTSCMKLFTEAATATMFVLILDTCSIQSWKPSFGRSLPFN